MKLLCTTAIAHIVLYNRPRPGEVVRAELFQYINHAPTESRTPDVLEVLSEEEIKALPHI